MCLVCGLCGAVVGIDIFYYIYFYNVTESDSAITNLIYPTIENKSSLPCVLALGYTPNIKQDVTRQDQAHITLYIFYVIYILILNFFRSY